MSLITVGVFQFFGSGAFAYIIIHAFLRLEEFLIILSAYLVVYRKPKSPQGSSRRSEKSRTENSLKLSDITKTYSTTSHEEQKRTTETEIA